MPGTVTPRRRQREEEDGIDDDGVASERESSADTADTSRSSQRKRVRHGSVDLTQEEHDENDSPLLPDTFRRSPKEKGTGSRQHGPRHHSEGVPQTHQAGSIVRVKMINFVTYTEAEFSPGPNLNMIIGPNGTGKSTLVCAICLGLGYSPNHLGRAKSVGEFVKHGSKQAEIEIELAADPARHASNPIITTRITKEGNKTKYFLDGKDARLKQVKELTSSFHIQVDNLCQFLPQDKVVEFAAMSPVDLLTATEKAAAPAEMTEWHMQLKEWRKEQKSNEIRQQSQMETMKNLEERQRGQEADVARLRERTELRERIAGLEKFRPFPEYRVAKERHAVAKARRKEAQKELKGLERRMEPNLRAVTAKEEYLRGVEKVVAHRKKLVERSETHVRQNQAKITEADERLQECAQEIEAESNSTKKVRQGIPQLHNNLKAIQRALQDPPEAIDFSQMNEQIREKTRQSRDLSEKMEHAREEVGSQRESMKQREQIIEQAGKDIESLKSQAGQKANKLRSASKDGAAAWDWIQKNSDKFSGRVFGPPIIECRVKDPKHASAVESAIPDGDKLAFTVTSTEDFDTLQRHLYGELKLSGINIRTAGQALATYHPPMARDQLGQYGLECWLLDLIEGPDEVLAMLCDNRNIHQTAFTTREISQAQYDLLIETSIGSWVTPSQTYLVSRRRDYGPGATSTRVQPLRPARFFTDAPVDQQAVQTIQHRINEVRYEIDELKKTATSLKAEFDQHKEEYNRIEQEKKEIAEEKAVKQRQKAEFDALPVKLEQAQKKLDEAQDKLRGSAELKRQIIARGDQICLEKGQLALDYANSVDALRTLHVSLFEAEILLIEAKSDLQQLRVQHAEEERLLHERREEVGELERVAAELLNAGKELQAQCLEIGEAMTDSEQSIYNEIEQWTPDQLQTEIESVQARVEMNSGRGNENLLREFEERARLIEKGTEQLIAIGAKIDKLGADIAGVREQWEPRLDALVAKISDAFAENFSRIQCAGEVAVHKDDDFEQWAIQIKVKFREIEQLSILDSHRQSGGERAVSTIFYLMALQSLARAPFRVVDEINQGMDPRNERLVHSRMVDIACAEHTSQYFLITPKLLNGLRYHPNMKVHCIASGEYMPDDHSKLDFGMLANKALALRRPTRAIDAGRVGAVAG